MDLDQDTLGSIQRIDRNLSGHKHTMDDLFVLVLYGLGMLNLLMLVDIFVHVYSATNGK